MIRNWEVLSRTLVNDFGIVKIHTKQARSPRTGDVRDILAIDFPDWALVLAITPKKEVVMVNQYRHGIEQVCLELPGGLIDPQDASPEVHQCLIIKAKGLGDFLGQFNDPAGGFLRRCLIADINDQVMGLRP